MTDSTLHHRHIRSFVRREGRMTPAQKFAIESLWQKYSVVPGAAPFDLDSVFGRRAPRILEIGFGMGDTLLQVAQTHPEKDYLGIEVHRPGVGALLMNLEKSAQRNVRVLCADAVEVLSHNISDAALHAVYIFFPDPWPKKRHHKRRLIQPALVELIGRKLKVGGLLHLATDWEDYAQHMLTVITAAPQFRNTASAGQFAPSPGERPPTKFERRGRALGHGVWDLIVERR